MVRLTPPGPHVEHQRSQEIEIRTRMGTSKGGLEIVFGHQRMPSANSVANWMLPYVDPSDARILCTRSP